MPYFQAAAKRNNIPVDLLIAQARQESGFNPNAAGGGLMQIQDKTALKPGFGMTGGIQNPAVLKDPKTNIDFGADYLAARAKAAEVRRSEYATGSGGGAARRTTAAVIRSYVQNVTRYMPAPAAPYNVATAGNAIPPPPSGPTAAPAAPLPVLPPVPPASAPPAPSVAPATPTPETRPDSALTWEEFQARHSTPITAASRPDLVVQTDPADQQRLQSAVDQAKSDLSYAIAPEDKTKAQIAYTTASNNLAQLRQDAAAKTSANILAAQKQQGELLSPLYQKQLELAQAPVLEAQRGKQAIQLEQAKGQTADESKVMQGLDETRESARAAVDQIGIARALSQSAGDPTFWQTVQKTHPAVVQAMANSGFLSPDTVNQLGQAGALDAATNKLISMARTGSGFQRMTNMDVQILSSQAPQSVDPQQWREAKLAYLQSYMERQLHYVDAVRSLRADGTPLYQAQTKAAQDQGDVVPTIPNFTDTPQRSAVQQRIDWAQSKVPPNTFFRAPDGQLRIYQPQPAPSVQQPQAPTLLRRPHCSAGELVMTDPLAWLESRHPTHGIS